MTKRLITLLAALLVLGFAISGCGDDENGADGNGDTTAAETATDTDTGTVTDDETVTDDVTETDTATDTDTATEQETETAEGGGAAAPTSRAQAVRNCEQGVNAAEQLSADARDKLTDLCENAASGDPDDVRDAAREVCETIVEDTFPEDSPGRDQALASCDNGGR